MFAIGSAKNLYTQIYYWPSKLKSHIHVHYVLKADFYLKFWKLLSLCLCNATLFCYRIFKKKINQ